LILDTSKVEGGKVEGRRQEGERLKGQLQAGALILILDTRYLILATNKQLAVSFGSL